MMTLAAVGALGLALIARPAGSRCADRPPRAGRGTHDLVLLGDLVVLGLLSGMPFITALEASAAHLSPALATDVRRVVNASRLDGSSVAFAAATGPSAPLTALAARATTTGAPMLAAVAAFTRELRNRQRADALADARRLAVRLVFPLALLILPGFVLLVAGPVIVDGLARFDL